MVSKKTSLVPTTTSSAVMAVFLADSSFLVGGRAESPAPVDLLTVICGGGRETSSSSKTGVTTQLAVLGTVGSGHVKS